MADAFSGNDVARLAFDGANTSTTMTDALAHTFTANGTAQLATATSRYGSASLLCNGAGTDYVSGATSADWNMGSGDFCIDFFYKPSTVTGGKGLFGISDGTTHSIRIFTVNNYIQANAYVGSTATSVVTSAAVSPQQQLVIGHWTHIALTRYGSTLNLYFDGVLTQSVAITGTLDWGTDPTVRIANDFVSANGATGSVDCVRITKGAARYTLPAHSIPCDGNFNTFDSVNVTTTNLGTNTRQISIYGTVSHDAVMAAIDAAVIALGWSVYDGWHRGMIHRVYRCLNKDGVTYKYAVLMMHRGNNRLYFTSCESWDTVNKTMTNEVWSNFRAEGMMGFALNNCEIIIYGNARWLGMCTYIMGNIGPWAMCVETEREAPEDTALAGLPCWGMIYSTSFTISPRGANSYWIRYPRLKNGWVGVSASLYFNQLTNISVYAGTRWSETVNSNTSYGNLTYGWDTAKKIISSVKPVHDNSGTITFFGRLFGIKLGPVLGQAMDKINLPVDSDYFYSGSGSNTDHWVLNTNYTANTFYKGIGGTNPTSASISLGGYVCHCLCFTGAYVYVGTNANGVYKIDLGAATGALIASTAAIGAVHDICFDGRYVYASGTSGVNRLDTTNADALTTLTIGSGGISALGYDGKQFLYAGQRSGATSMSVFKIDTTTFTSVATITLPTRVTGSRVMEGICTDGVNTMGCLQFNQTTAADCTIHNISISGNTDSAYTINAGYTPTCGGLTWAGAMFQVTLGSSTVGAYDHLLPLGTGTPYGTTASYISTDTSTITAQTTIRAYCDRFGCMQVRMHPGNAVNNHGVSNYSSVEINSTSTATVGAFGGIPQTTFIRSYLGTVNTALAIGNDNLLYNLTNLWQRNYNGITYGQALIPK